MTRRMVLYEVGKALLLLAEIACAAFIGYTVVMLLWFGVQYALSAIDPELMTSIADGGLPDRVAFAAKYIRFFNRGITAKEATDQLIRFGVMLAAGVGVLTGLRLCLRRLEREFKQRYMPEVLEQTFSDFTYEAKRRSAVEEVLCDVGLLSTVERYYTANRLEGLYRDCWVAAQEIICGGVYADDYTSHKIKVRGQWLTIRLNMDFESVIILESRETKNRFSHRGLAKQMVELQPDHTGLAQQFRCFADSPDDFRSLLTVEMAEKILSMTDRYPDFCVIFRRGCIHILIRRRSFNRRWEPLCPFCFPQLKREAHRLYGPLMDFTDMLLE
ncbi:MAG: DUF3137 domain-containing protein [Oscillospiraceae bacterium]|nr:DUF3137 domain-containing protein [Oscillospiraceae bacterium]